MNVFQFFQKKGKLGASLAAHHRWRAEREGRLSGGGGNLCDAKVRIFFDIYKKNERKMRIASLFAHFDRERRDYLAQWDGPGGGLLATEEDLLVLDRHDLDEPAARVRPVGENALR